MTSLAAQAAALARRPAARWTGAALLACLLALVHQATFLGAATDPASRGPAALAEVRRLVLEQWVEEPDPKALDEAALRGLVGELAARGDPFSQWVPPDELSKFEEETSGQFGGLGILVNVVDGLVHVIAPIEDTPAWKAGILPGDIVLKLDGKDYAFETAAEAVAALKGAPGSTITLLVRHAAGDEPPRSVELVRAIIQVRSVKGARLLDREAKIGYLRITAFNAGTVDEALAAAKDLLAQGLRGLILDLRGNPGGYLDAAARIADAFLPEGAKIVETRARAPGAGHVIEASGERVLAVPVAILIDGGTASASEVLAGALADDGVATLVGSRSYGKGSVQSLLPVLGGEAQLKLTTQYYFTPSGRRIHRGGRAADDPSWGLLPHIPLAVAPHERARLAAAEADADLERLKAKAGGAPSTAPERLHLDDPQVAAAFAHLRAVLAGEARLGPQPAGVAPVGSASTAPVESTTGDDAPPPYGE